MHHANRDRRAVDVSLLFPEKECVCVNVIKEEGVGEFANDPAIIGSHEVVGHAGEAVGIADLQGEIAGVSGDLTLAHLLPETASAGAEIVGPVFAHKNRNETFPEGGDSPITIGAYELLKIGIPRPGISIVVSQ